MLLVAYLESSVLYGSDMKPLKHPAIGKRHLLPAKPVMASEGIVPPRSSRGAAPSGSDPVGLKTLKRSPRRPPRLSEGSNQQAGDEADATPRAIPRSSSALHDERDESSGADQDDYGSSSADEDLTPEKRRSPSMRDSLYEWRVRWDEIPDTSSSLDDDREEYPPDIPGVSGDELALLRAIVPPPIARGRNTHHSRQRPFHSGTACCPSRSLPLSPAPDPDLDDLSDLELTPSYRYSGAGMVVGGKLPKTSTFREYRSDGDD